MKKIILFFAALFMAVVASAQADEVTLTVIGTGVNEEKATLQALRSAIEQSFGTFVSANTTILNDKLVQDEIVSVSNGNVKEYKKLAVAALPNGQVTVSVQATVSINKLISYAKSKGSRAEFAGQTFAANVKLMKLRSESATKAYELMVQQMKLIAKDMFDFEIQIGSPSLSYNKQSYEIPYTVIAYANASSSNFSTLYESTCKSLEISKEDARKFEQETGIWVFRPGTLGELREIYMPIDLNTKSKLEKEITKIYKSALLRYKIGEINRVSFQNSTNYIDAAYASTEVAERQVGSGSIYQNIFLDWNILKISQTKEPIQLSRAEQREVKKGTFRGKTYTIKYGPQNKVHIISGKLIVPQDQMERIGGFELIGVSAPTNKAK